MNSLFNQGDVICDDRYWYHRKGAGQRMSAQGNSSPTDSSASSIWQHKNFVILLSTGFLLSFGSRVYELALPLIIYELTQSSVAMGTMRAIQFLPILLFGMAIGVFVDRADKKRWMLTITPDQKA